MFGKNHLFTYSRLPELWDSLDEICLGNWKPSVYADDSAELFNLEKDPWENTNLYGVETYRAVQADLSTRLLKRLLSVKMRDVRTDWDFSQFPRDVRFEPLEQ